MRRILSGLGTLALALSANAAEEAPPMGGEYGPIGVVRVDVKHFAKVVMQTADKTTPPFNSKKVTRKFYHKFLKDNDGQCYQVLVFDANNNRNADDGDTFLIDEYFDWDCTLKDNYLPRLKDRKWKDEGLDNQLDECTSRNDDVVTACEPITILETETHADAFEKAKKEEQLDYLSLVRKLRHLLYKAVGR